MQLKESTAAKPAGPMTAANLQSLTKPCRRLRRFGNEQPFNSEARRNFFCGLRILSTENPLAHGSHLGLQMLFSFQYAAARLLKRLNTRHQPTATIAWFGHVPDLTERIGSCRNIFLDHSGKFNAGHVTVTQLFNAK